VTEWLLLLMLGAAVGLDSSSFPQMMFSRPLVAGSLAGLVFGEPAAGAVVGGMLELFQLSILPIGAAKYPEAGIAAVAASAAYVNVANAHVDPPALLLAVLAGLVWERAAGASAIWLRERNADLATIGEDVRATPAEVERRHLLCTAADLARGAIVTAAGAGLALAFVHAGAALWSGPPLLALVPLTVAAAGAAGSGLTIFGGWKDRHLQFLAGATVGALLLLAQ
jgi:hypothetical protein